jgi:hypothetical protein
VPVGDRGGRGVGIAVAAPLLGEIAAAVELAVMLTIIGTALFGSQAHSDRAFRLLRWIGNRPEPPALPPSPPPVAAREPARPQAR